MPCRLVLRTGLRVDIPDDMRDRVTVLDHVSYADLRGLYAAASVVVVPLKPVDHPSGITSLFEGLAMGRPVVASRIGSTQHVVQHRLNGLLVPPGDAAALRAALAELMEDRPLAERLGAEGRVTIDGAFTYRAYVDRFASALRRHAQVRHKRRGAHRGIMQDDDADAAAGIFGPFAAPRAAAGKETALTFEGASKVPA